MVLYTRGRQTGKIIPIDSVQTRNGSFSFSIDPAIYPEPIRVFLNHIQDGTDSLRMFQYQTNLRYRGGSLSVEGFMLEDGIQVNGVLKRTDYRNTGFRLKPKIIATHIDRPLVLGRQTQVMYNDTLGFDYSMASNRLTSVEQVRNAVRQHPYSYHYLYALERRVTEFPNRAFMEIFQCFDPEVQDSPTGQKLLAYVKGRPTERLTFATTLVDERGQLQPILDKQARYNLVVLWASWCGPCRQEIPRLKQTHGRLRDSRQLHMVSVSLDENRVAWERAVKKEQMPWQQLLITPPLRMYVNEMFQFDGSIPTLLLVDQKGEVIKKMVGYDEKDLAALETMITR